MKSLAKQHEHFIGPIDHQERGQNRIPNRQEPKSCEAAKGLVGKPTATSSVIAVRATLWGRSTNVKSPVFQRQSGNRGVSGEKTGVTLGGKGDGKPKTF